jgi:hypothetical protein
MSAAGGCFHRPVSSYMEPPSPFHGGSGYGLAVPVGADAFRSKGQMNKLFLISYNC